MKMQYNIAGVEARYPRINRPYRFDDKEMKSLPCDALDEGAAYDISFVMSKEQATELHKVAMQSWENAKAADTKRKWPEKPTNLPYKTDEQTGSIIGKAKLRAAYNGEKTRPPMQYDAKNNLLQPDFLLTTGSKINLALTIVPYNTGAVNGISLRLRAVQVIELAEPIGGASPFQSTDGFTNPDASPFDNNRDSIGKSIGIGEATVSGKIAPGEMTAVPTQGKPIDWEVGEDVPF
jgi:hypothetical protein